jgi:uncharacterized RDD family membrane protein YckC
MSQWGPLAPWGERALGFLIDYGVVIVVVIALYIVGLIVGAIADVLGLLVFFVAWAFSLVAFAYLGYINGTTGRTPGKLVMGLKVVGEETGQTIGGGMGIVRWLAHIVDSLICYIGWFFPLWDAKRQTISDKIVKTVVTNGHPKSSVGDAFKGLMRGSKGI